MFKQNSLLAISILALAACGGGDDDKSGGETAEFDRNPYPSTYTPRPSETVFITNATVLDGVGNLIENGSVLLEDGRIAAVGEDIKAPDGASTIDA